MFCPNCGASVQGRFCAKCGTAVDVATGGTGPSTSATGAAPGPGAQPYSAPARAGGLDQNVAGALAYVLGFITGILFLVLEPYNKNRFVRFHAFQSIFLNVAWVVFWIAETMLAFVLPWGLMTMIAMLVMLGFLAVWVLLLVKAYNNEMFKLPIIGDLAEKQA